MSLAEMIFLMQKRVPFLSHYSTAFLSSAEILLILLHVNSQRTVRINCCEEYNVLTEQLLFME